jgi:SAM-dependent methyltransferase
LNPVEYNRMYEAEDSHWWYVGLHQLIIAAIRRESHRLGRPLKIFDAGCGTGRLCQLLTDQGHEVSGCDASEEAVRLCRRRGVDIYQADLNSLELEADSFDVITSMDVLYHSGIIDDVAVMKRLGRALKPGGMLLLNLVAHEFLRSTHDIAVHTRERYTRKLLRGRLLEAQFDVELISYRVSILFPFIAIYRLLAGFFHRSQTDAATVDSDVALPHWLMNTLLLRTLQVENVLLPMAPLPLGSSIFVAARKPPANREG